MTGSESIKSLAGTTCPACGRGKQGRKSLCGACYFALPQGVRNQLYKRVGQGYEAALEAALSFLSGKVDAADATIKAKFDETATPSLFGGGGGGGC